MVQTADHNGYISRGNMTVIISAAGLVMLAFGGFIAFQNSATDRRIADIKEELTRVESNYLRKDEHAEFKLRTDKDIARVEADGVRRAGINVPRTELEARWEASDKNIKLVSDRLNELRTATTSTYTLRDEINRLQLDLSELRKVVATDRK